MYFSSISDDVEIKTQQAQCVWGKKNSTCTWKNEKEKSHQGVNWTNWNSLWGKSRWTFVKGAKQQNWLFRVLKWISSFCNLIRMWYLDDKLLVYCRKAESRNEVCLDLRSQDPANVPNLLRFHLKQLANIPCKISAWRFEFINSFVANHLIFILCFMIAAMDYLNVIIGVDDGSFKMGQRRRKVWFYQIMC